MVLWVLLAVGYEETRLTENQTKSDMEPRIVKGKQASGISTPESDRTFAWMIVLRLDIMVECQSAWLVARPRAHTHDEPLYMGYVT